MATQSLAQLDPSARLGAGWYLNWRTERTPFRPHSMEFVQMIRLKGGLPNPDLDTLRAVVGANPGSLWLIGNEPDVKWQDSVTPEKYAQLYRQLHTYLKAQDPTCQVAIGGVAQPTPLRLSYLGAAMDYYESAYHQQMPVDVWNVHAFILREERDAWGVGIPPGLPDAEGMFYDVQDHDDLQIFAAQIVAFRRWMMDRGQRDRPLMVSEYGILMPEDYGFDPERVRDFMEATFTYFLTASDDQLGYPLDDNRLVQRWAWYSLGDVRYPTGNLIDLDTRALTPLGLAFRQYIDQQATRAGGDNTSVRQP